MSILQNLVDREVCKKRNIFCYSLWQYLYLLSRVLPMSLGFLDPLRADPTTINLSTEKDGRQE